MESILPVDKPKSFDNYRDSLTHLFSINVLYDTLKREISFAKREGNEIAVVKFQIPKNTSLEQFLYFANELEQAVRKHDLISRVSEREFVALLRFDSKIGDACQSLVMRIKNLEKREFKYAWVISDGTKDLEQVLDELDNPQLLHSSKYIN